MKITKQQELDYIVSITAGLLASGHFTYVRQDGKGAEFRDEAIAAAELVWSQIKSANGVEISDLESAVLLAGMAKAEPKKGKDK